MRAKGALLYEWLGIWSRGMNATAECKNLLECALFWESAGADRIWLTQPMGGGDSNIKTWTWAEAGIHSICVALWHFLPGLPFL